MQMKARRETILGEEALGTTERMCTGCFSVYFDKHWHAPAFFGGAASVKRARLKGGLCDACRMKTAKEPASYAGEVTVAGRFAADDLAEIVRLIRNVGKRAMRRDPEDRILSLERTKDGVRIRTSENQLAVSIGKQVHRARKGTDLTITWSHHDKPVRVRITR